MAQVPVKLPHNESEKIVNASVACPVKFVSLTAVEYETAGEREETAGATPSYLKIETEEFSVVEFVQDISQVLFP